MACRVPLSQWRWPSQQILRGERYPQGPPPFAPFPDVTTVINARLCPVAASHDLLHGLDALESGQGIPGINVGNHFHAFVAELRIELASGRWRLPPGSENVQEEAVRQRVVEYVDREHLPASVALDVWNDFVGPWVKRKLDIEELQQLRGREIISEVDVGHPRVPFQLNGRWRHYPLRGRIDELDITGRRLIERTSRGLITDAAPPFLKDYQAWLLAKILTALQPGQYPQRWKSLIEGPLTIVVETPYRDFVVIDDPLYLQATHEAYGWIHDIAAQAPRVAQEVYDHAACTPNNPHPECGHKFINCFPHPRPHPQSRPEMRQEFKRWFAPLLYEQMWAGDLWHYRLLMLDRQELEDQRLVLEARIITPPDVSGRRLILEMPTISTSAHLRGRERFIVIPGGTLHCGPRIRARVVSIEPVNPPRITLELQKPIANITGTALLLPPGGPVPVLDEEPLTYLYRQEQIQLFRLQYMGCDDPHEADTSSFIQLIEAIFGRRQIDTGGNAP